MFRKITSISAIAASILAIASFQPEANAQTKAELRPICDSLTTIMKEKTSVYSKITLERVMKRGDVIDLYFGQTLSDFPWRDSDVAWFKKEIKKLIPEEYKNIAIGNVFCKGTRLEALSMPSLGNNGKPSGSIFRTADPRHATIPFIEQENGLAFEKGMTGRYIALWQSHGRYFEEKTNKWEWQRATLFQTVEDMYTQSYVLPYLIPMLENAGAYCLTPRERDTQKWEVVADNDPSFKEARTGYTRKAGYYSESGSWKDAGVGFADAQMLYYDTENPFQMGTVRMTEMISKKSSSKPSVAKWTFPTPERGKYAVYISYKTLENSTKSAHYTVKHMAGETSFLVDQTRGGSTWIYLGTFEFEKGEGEVTLDNVLSENRKAESGTVVTADAVKIGGGIGKIARGLQTDPKSEWTTSGLPAFTEGALYWMQWAGVDEEILNAYETDYTKDYAERGKWVEMMSAGSRTNPKGEGKGIPFDLSFAFHTDAGTFPDDSIVGTLSIYTLLADGSREYPNGEDRMLGRLLADQVQTQMVQDARAEFEPNWTRRQLWDRSYSESRTTAVPGMLLEYLSHQNFADMKYGLDPSFQFTSSRAIYKGMLKFLSIRYGCDYVVQPLPVNSFAATMPSNGKVKLQWKPTEDTLEPTAKPNGYILYTRIDGGAFDQGKEIETSTSGDFVCYTQNIEPGHIYSYMIEAFNDGGKSFPSEILSVGIPSNSKGMVAIVNDFDRVSAPAWFDSPTYAGFNSELDRGVGDQYRINFIGDQYNFRREQPWLDDDCPGFGACWQDSAGDLIIGNTFDYPYIHGKAIMAAGYSFISMSRDAFSADISLANGTSTMDIICGKQVTTMMGRGAVPNRYSVFPTDFQDAIKSYTSNGGNILISGSHIGTDVWDEVYPAEVDEAYRNATKTFVQDILGYKWLTNYSTRSGEAHTVYNDAFMPSNKNIAYHKDPNNAIYNVETADGILPSNENGKEFLRYSDTNIPAGVEYQANNYKVISIGFPIETIQKESELNSLINDILSFLK